MTSALLAAALALPIPPLLGIDGRRHNVSLEALGKPVALVFIAHDCPVCNTYAPEFARIAAKYGGTAWFGLVYEEPDITLNVARQHARAYRLAGAHLYLDPKGLAAKAAGAGMTPEAAVFSAGGRRTYLGRVDNLFYDFGKQRAAATTHDLRDAIDATLAHRPAKLASGPPIGCVIETARL